MEGPRNAWIFVAWVTGHPCLEIHTRTFSAQAVRQGAKDRLLSDPAFTSRGAPSTSCRRTGRSSKVGAKVYVVDRVEWDVYDGEGAAASSGQVYPQ